MLRLVRDKACMSRDAASQASDISSAHKMPGWERASGHRPTQALRLTGYGLGLTFSLCVWLGLASLVF